MARVDFDSRNLEVLRSPSIILTISEHYKGVGSDTTESWVAFLKSFKDEIF